ncbi:MAG TPA: hypothetical protein VHT26_03175 [Trebonia sp.]|nr:hypothetical protein [Trebonia sp.]
MSHIAVAAIGAAVILVAWLSVIRTVYTPRQRSSLTARWTVRIVAAVIALPARLTRQAGRRERILDLCAPVSLLLMGLIWAVAGTAGFALVAWGAVGLSFAGNGLANFFFMQSGGAGLAAFALLSTGFMFASFSTHLTRVLSAYGSRERPVARLAAQATESPDAEVVLADYLRKGSRDHLDSMFGEWSAWFADLQTTHLSYPAMAYLRPYGRLCWAKAAMIVLDCAAITEATAPEWAPPNTRPLLAIGSFCLPRLAMQMGEDESRSPVSYHGREMRSFAETYRLAVKAGLPTERGEVEAETAFQRIRVKYAPYVIAIGERLHYHDVD